VSLELPNPLALDSDCLIYVLESPGSKRGSAIIAHLESAPTKTLFTSSVTISEILVKPFAERGRDYAMGLLRAFLDLPGLTLVPVEQEIATLAAELRAETRLKLPYAIQAATAIVSGARALLTNDGGLARAGLPIPVLRLDDLL